MARTDPQVNLRMPAELKLKLAASSAISNRSLNAEIVARLESSFSDEPSTEARLSKLERSILAEQFQRANNKVNADLASLELLKLISILESAAAQSPDLSAHLDLARGIVKNIQPDLAASLTDMINVSKAVKEKLITMVDDPAAQK